MTFRPCLALALALLAAAGPAAAQAPECGALPADAHTLACTCAAGMPQGSVWGSGPYTADSDICTAAVHAGVIDPAAGGQVIVMPVIPPASFAGTAANGVTTSGWGAYDRAFTFMGAEERVGLPVCGPLGEAATLTCLCEAGAGGGGAVWGSGPSTADSHVCAAALHAGVIGPEGGEVTLNRLEGQPSYMGSTANGVTTLDYGSYGASFAFAPGH